jgi:predicted phosphate transport protein (TIGR00153 family)
VALRLRPTDTSFYELFTTSAQHLVTGAGLLTEMISDGADREAVAKRMREAEHICDENTHAIVRRVNSSFVTPFDREDIYALISGLDDVLDFIEEAADTFVLYRVEAPTATAVEQAAIIVKQVELLHDALAHLEGFKGLDRYWIEVHRLENEGDRIVRAAIAGLFVDEKDSINLVKWKDIYGLLEATIDKAEDVANIIERITIKHA